LPADQLKGMTGADPFETFVRRYQDMVFSTAVRLLGNPAEAEDVSQTVFLKAFQRFGQLQDSPAAGGWLKTVARHECLNHLSRHRARWRLFSELGPAGADTGDAFASTVVAPGSPADELEQLEAREQLEEAIRRLPDHQRVPLVLFHLEDMSYQDIASTLGVTLAKVKTDIFRAREALRRHLQADHASR